MKLVYDGKTKAVYELPDGNFLLQFKDDVTGANGVFDPGANTVGLSIEGMGQGGLRLSEYFFGKINAAGFPTHFISADIENATMTVKPAKAFGKGLEHICRYKAVGSFMRRFGMYAQDGQALDGLVEVTIKDDDAGDPPITEDIAVMLGITTSEEYQTLKKMTREICDLIKAELAAKGMELFDIKLEFGRVDGGQIALIDEVSGGNMRVYKDGKKVEPLDLVKYMLD